MSNAQVTDRVRQTDNRITDTDYQNQSRTEGNKHRCRIPDQIPDTRQRTQKRSQEQKQICTEKKQIPDQSYRGTEVQMRWQSPKLLRGMQQTETDSR
jgi:hypothetical protein